MSAPPKRALIADDTDVARAAVVRRLRAEGVAFLEATSAATAAATDPAALSCALIDLDLGDGNGVDVALALRAKRPDLAVAFFTAGASAELQARAAAIARVFAKPDELDRVIEWLLANAGN